MKSWSTKLRKGRLPRVSIVFFGLCCLLTLPAVNAIAASGDSAYTPSFWSIFGGSSMFLPSSISVPGSTALLGPGMLEQSAIGMPRSPFPQVEPSPAYVLEAGQEQNLMLPDKVVSGELQIPTPVIASPLQQAMSEAAVGELIRVIITLKAQPHFEGAAGIKQDAKHRINQLEQMFPTNSRAFLEAVDRETALMRRALGNHARMLFAPTQERLVEQLVRLDGEVLYRYSFFNGVAARLSAQALDLLQENSLIYNIVLDEISQPALDNSLPSVFTNIWHAAGYDGTPWDVAVLDTGVDSSHPALSSRVIAAQSFVTGVPSADDIHGHGTHVAGIVASTDATYGGVAPTASIINAKIGHPNAFLSDVIAGAEWAAIGTADDAEIVNHSYTLSTSGGQFIDAYVYYFDIIWVGAAGNAGPGSGTVTNVGYNMITAGNMEDVNTVSRTDDFIRASSSRGPTSDGRMKPDICAPGTGILSCAYNWEGGNPDFMSMSGTSMASPHIAGAVALLYDYAATEETKYYKALLMQTAEDWGTAGPENTHGWGYMDLASAYANRQNVWTRTIQDGESQYFKVYLTAGSSYKATLVFERHGYYNITHNIYNLLGVSDLDLMIYGPDDSLLDTSNSGLDNVEQVVISSAPETGWYRIRVYGYDVPSNIVDESYSLAADGGTSIAYPPTIPSLTVNTLPVSVGALAGSYERSQRFNIEITVSDGDTLPADITVDVDVYTPGPTYAWSHVMQYNITSGMWEVIWFFDSVAELGTWLYTIEVNDESNLTAYHNFYINCLNEDPAITSIDLSTASFRRVNDSLTIEVVSSDYHDGNNLDVTLRVTKADSSNQAYPLAFNPSTSSFSSDIILSEAEPTGSWIYRVESVDQEGGVTTSTLESFDVLSHQYRLTITTLPAGLDPQPTASPSGEWVDAGTYVMLTAEQVPGYVFDHWEVDGVALAVGDHEIILVMNHVKTAIAYYQTALAMPILIIGAIAVVIVVIVVIVLVLRRRGKS